MEQQITEHDKDHFHATMEWVRSIDYSEWNTPFAVTLKFWRGTNRQVPVERYAFLEQT